MPSFLSFLPEFPVLSGNFEKRAHLSRCHAKLSLSSCAQTHNEICRRKEQTVLEQVLPDAAILRLARTSAENLRQSDELHFISDSLARLTSFLYTTGSPR